MNGSTNIQTAVRIRPYIAWEKNANIKPLWQVKENSIVQILDETFFGESYTFDHIFEENKTNQDVYSDVVKPLVISCLQGINSTIFAYGQTSSGKTHTMLGDKDTPGIIGLAVDDVFKYMEEKSTNNFLLRCSYLEIYNEKINDLLHSNVTDLKIREDINQGVHVIVKEEIIRTPEELFTLMKKGMKSRKVGSTDMNERSSRSHSIFKLVIQSQSEGLEGSYTESTLSLVDLAGSERVGQMKMGKDRQLEGVSINKSLTALGLVIRKLSEGESFINYRDSKLTRILQHSLGGNSKTLIIATITVAVSEETKSTLEFAHRAKFVKNRPVVNRRVTDKDQLKEYESLCQNYKVQIEKLTVEKLDKEKIINALEGKIQCIQRFREFGQASASRHRVASRRHTFAHFKPESKTNQLAFSLLSIDEECFKDGEIYTPAKSDIQSDENETDIIDDRENFLTPNKKPPFQDLDSPKTTITKLKLENQLLEESYENLVLFTNLENQIKLECDEFNEMRDLVDRLRNDNLGLREDRPIIMASVKYVYNQLNKLQIILGGSVERNYEHLYTIPEEKIDFVLENTEIAEKISDDEEKIRFKNELSKKNEIIDGLKEELNIEKMRFESVLTEMNKLKEDITVKNFNIDKLNSVIIQGRDIKEAELDILNRQIEKLTSYKQEMHIKLSEYQRTEEESNSTHSIQQENITFKNNLDVLKRDNQELNEKNKALEHQLHCAMLDLNDKSQLYDTILKNYSQKTTLAETLEKKIQDLQSQFEDNDPERSSGHQEQLVEKLSTKLNEVEGLIKFKSSEIADLKIQSGKQSNDNKILTELLSEQQNSSKEKDSKLSILQATNEALNTEIIKLRDEINCIKSELEDLEFQLTGEQKELGNVFEQLESKSGKVRELELAISALINVREEQTQHIRELTASNVGLYEDISKKDRELNNLMEKNADLSEQCHTLKQSVSEHIKQISNLFGSHVIVKQDSNHNEKQNFKEVTDNLREQSQSLKNIFDAQSKHIADLSTSNLDIKEDITRKNEELQELKKTSERITKQYESLEHQFSEQSKQIEELCSSNADLQKCIITKNNAREELTNTNKILSDQIHSLKQHVNEIATNLSSLRNANENIQVELEKKTMELQVAIRSSSDKDRTINDLERKVEELISRVEQAERRVSQIMQEKIVKCQSNCNSDSGESELHEKLQKIIVNVQTDNNKLLADVDNYLKDVQSLQAIVQAQKTDNAALTTKLQIKTKSFDENVANYNKIIGELEKIRKEKEYLEQRLQENRFCKSPSRDMNSRLKSDDLDKLGPEQNSLRARNQELEKQVVDLEISLRKRTQLFTNLSRHLKTLQDQKETSLKDVSKFEPERMTQIEPVMQSKKLVVPKQGMTIADLFGKPVNKVRVQDNSSQTEETCQISTENAKLEAIATECAQQLDKQRKIMDKLTAALKKSKFEFKSRTLEDQIQELLLSVKRVPIANQEPSKTCCQSDQRKSALRVSDEMRKVKERRQSIHDQRRGLSGDGERFSLDDFDCESCASLRNKAIELRSQITALTDEVDKLKSENKLLDKEGTEMLQMIRNYDESEMELYNKLRKYEQCQKVDKETQASCDLQQKYNALKRLVKLRKREGINTQS